MYGGLGQSGPGQRPLLIPEVYSLLHRLRKGVASNGRTPASTSSISSQTKSEMISGEIDQQIFLITI
jgi:hypothetical protein